MKCALHVHTSLSDGSSTPEEMIRAYEDLGFGLVAITDHEFLLHEDYIPRIRAVKTEIIVLIGVEIDYQPWNYHHLLRIYGNEETLNVLCHPGSYYLEVPEVLSRINNAPFPVHAVEVTHRGFYAPHYNTPEIPVPKIASDDAHDVGDAGRAWIEVHDSCDADEVLRRVKRGEFRIRFYR